MELEKALSQISEIHAQVLKTEVFRGYRAATMLVTASLALLGASAQRFCVPAQDAEAFIAWWVGLALVCAAICAWDILRHSCDGRQWRKTLQVVAQSIPALIVGALVTLVLLRMEAPPLHLLPGLWAVIYSLGIWAGRPYLPRAVGGVALFYLLAGLLQLTTVDPVGMPSPWGMGLTFGAGQILLAGILYLNLERPDGLRSRGVGR